MIILSFPESRAREEASRDTNWNHGNGLYRCSTPTQPASHHISFLVDVSLHKMYSYVTVSGSSMMGVILDECGDARPATVASTSQPWKINCQLFWYFLKSFQPFIVLFFVFLSKMLNICWFLSETLVFGLCVGHLKTLHIRNWMGSSFSFF